MVVGGGGGWLVVVVRCNGQLVWLVAVVVEQKWCSAYWLLLSVAGGSWY